MTDKEMREKIALEVEKELTFTRDKALRENLISIEEAHWGDVTMRQVLSVIRGKRLWT